MKRMIIGGALGALALLTQVTPFAQPGEAKARQAAPRKATVASAPVATGGGAEFPRSRRLSHAGWTHGALGHAVPVRRNGWPYRC